MLRKKKRDLYILLPAHAVCCSKQQRALRPHGDQHQLRLLRGRVGQAQGPRDVGSLYLH